MIITKVISCNTEKAGLPQKSKAIRYYLASPNFTIKMAREKKYSWTKFSWRLFSGIQLRFAINNQTTVTVNRRKCTAITSLNFMQPMHHLCLLVSKHADIHWCISPIHWCLVLCTVGFHNPRYHLPFTGVFHPHHLTTLLYLHKTSLCLLAHVSLGAQPWIWPCWMPTRKLYWLWSLPPLILTINYSNELRHLCLHTVCLVY